MPYPKRSKYRNIKTEVDGFLFDSKKEAARYVVLKQQQEDGVISNLRRQVPYKLSYNGTWICTYNADFVYTNADGSTITEDVKGRRTAVYMLKRRLMRILLGITILET